LYLSDYTWTPLVTPPPPRGVTSGGLGLLAPARWLLFL
jgi:hypothetical protein